LEVNPFYLPLSLLKIALLVPISGRNGIHSNPDLLVAMVTVAFGLLITAFIVGLISFDIEFILPWNVT